MVLTAHQMQLRDGRVTASFIPHLMFGNEDKILNEWRRLIGDPDYVDDFKPSWFSEYGSYLESFMLDWREKKNGNKLTRRGECVYHPSYPWASCTLDAASIEEDMVVECKTMNNFRDAEEAVRFYSWQVLYQCGITGYKRGVIYGSRGGMEPEEIEIERNDHIETTMWTRARWFYNCVESLTPPVKMSEAKYSGIKEAMRTVDMQGNNAWASSAADWLANKEPAKKFKEATEAIKELIESDVGNASGHGITVKKSKDGKLSIKELKS